MASLTRLGLTALSRRVLTPKHGSSKQSVRKMGGGEWYYRDEQPQTPAIQWAYSTIIGFVTIFWSGYMTYNHFGHIVGEYPTIEPSKWTDEELGIPPDEEDIYPEGYVPLSQRT